MRLTIEDQSDGWWHCAEHLSAEVVDGPMSVDESSQRFWLVRVSPVIRWHGEQSYAERLGQDHPLVNAMASTDHAFVGETSFDAASTTLGIPAYPAQLSGGTWEPVMGLGAKVRLTKL